jgi:hypothetical protein
MLGRDAAQQAIAPQGSPTLTLPPRMGEGIRKSTQEERDAARAPSWLARRIVYLPAAYGIATGVGKKASPCKPLKPVATGKTIPVFKSSNPTSFLTLAAV